MPTNKLDEFLKKYNGGTTTVPESNTTTTSTNTASPSSSIDSFLSKYQGGSSAQTSTQQGPQYNITPRVNNSQNQYDPSIVKEIQKTLGLQVDGIYGPQTQSAVRNYQKKYGLKVDGIAGPQTLKAMLGSPVKKSPVNYRGTLDVDEIMSNKADVQPSSSRNPVESFEQKYVDKNSGPSAEFTQQIADYNAQRNVPEAAYNAIRAPFHVNEVIGPPPQTAAPAAISPYKPTFSQKVGDFADSAAKATKAAGYVIGNALGAEFIDNAIDSFSGYNKAINPTTGIPFAKDDEVYNRNYFIGNPKPVGLQDMDTPDKLAYYGTNFEKLLPQPRITGLNQKVGDQGFFGNIKNAWTYGMLTSDYGIERYKQVNGVSNNADALRGELGRYSDLQQNMTIHTEDLLHPIAFLEKAFMGAASQLPLQVKSLLHAAPSTVAWSILGGGTGRKVAATVSSFDYIKKEETANAYDSFLNSGMTPAIAKNMADKYGIASAAIETLQIMTLLKSVPGLNQLVLAPAKQATKQAVIKSAKQALLNAGKEGVKEWAKTALSESIEEGVQQLAQDIMYNVGVHLDNQRNNKNLQSLNIGQILADAGSTAAQTLPSMLVTGGLGGIGTFSSTYQANKAQLPPKVAEAVSKAKKGYKPTMPTEELTNQDSQQNNAENDIVRRKPNVEENENTLETIYENYVYAMENWNRLKPEEIERLTAAYDDLTPEQQYDIMRQYKENKNPSAADITEEPVQQKREFAPEEVEQIKNGYINAMTTPDTNKDEFTRAMELYEQLPIWQQNQIRDEFFKSTDETIDQNIGQGNPPILDQIVEPENTPISEPETNRIPISQQYEGTHEYISNVAEELRNDVQNTVKGQKFVYTDKNSGEKVITAQRKITSPTIEKIQNITHAKYADIMNALTKIQLGESKYTKLMHTIESIIDENLSNGYVNFEGVKVPPNKEYINLKSGGNTQDEIAAVEEEPTSDLNGVQGAENSLEGNTYEEHVKSGADGQQIAPIGVQADTDKEVIRLIANMDAQGVPQSEQDMILYHIDRLKTAAKAVGKDINFLVKVVDSIDDDITDTLLKAHNLDRSDNAYIAAKTEVQSNNNIIDITISYVATKDTAITQEILHELAEVWNIVWEASNPSDYETAIKFLVSKGMEETEAKESLAEILTDAALGRGLLSPQSIKDTAYKNIFIRIVAEFKSWVTAIAQRLNYYKKMVWKQLPDTIKEQAKLFADNRWEDALANTGHITKTHAYAMKNRVDKTSLNQVAKLFKNDFQFGPLNIDIGGGKFDAGTNYLANKGIDSYVFDTFSRNMEHNAKVLEAIKGREVDTVTCANVLNVIENPEDREGVIAQAAAMVKENGTAYFQIYEGNKSGEPAATSTGTFQNNWKTENYMPEIKKYFREAVRKSNYIIATGPIKENISDTLIKRQGRQFGLNKDGEFDIVGQHDLSVFLKGGTKKWVAKREKNSLGITGKKTNDGTIYFHKSLIENLPSEVKNVVEAAAQQIPDNFDFAVVKYKPTGNEVSFIQSPDFDTADEPTVGDSYKVYENGDTKFTKGRSKNKQIYHHKWEMVADDYKGFDVEASKQRSELWKNSDIPEAMNTTQIGNSDYWQKVLDKLSAFSVKSHEKDAILERYKKYFGEIKKPEQAQPSQTNDNEKPKAEPRDILQKPEGQNKQPINDEIDNSGAGALQGDKIVYDTDTKVIFHTKSGELNKGILKAPVYNDDDEASVRFDFGDESSGVPILRSEYIPVRNIIKEDEASPALRIAVKVKQALDRGIKITPQWMYNWAKSAYNGKTMATGEYSIKDVTDSLELGVNKYLLSQHKMRLSTNNADIAKENLRSLEDMQELLPTQNKRTEEMEVFQQFSTPPAIAYVASWAANITHKDILMEPSAGIGGLAVFGKINHAKSVTVNELSERRAAILKEMNFDRLFTENAEQLHNILPDDIKPSVVLMNPPFSSTAGRMKNNSTKFATRHIEQALERLVPGGRLVAIVGQGMSDTAPTFAKWWSEIKKEYNVRANIGIAGSNFKKYGTTFDIQILVIDKDGATPDNSTLTGQVEDMSNLIDMLEAIRNDRPNLDNRDRESGQNPNMPENQGINEQTEDTTGIGITNNDESNPMGASKSGGNSTRAERDEGANAGGNRAINPKPKINDADVEDGTAGGAGVESVRNEDVGNTGREDNRNTVGEDGGTGNTIEVGTKTKDEVKKEQKTASKELGDSVFETYTPQKVKIKGAKKHPGILAQSAAMAAVQPPNPSYTPNLPQSIITSGLLSDAQLETVVYAGQAHQEMLPDGTRKAFFLGDGTGVGKGRQISGIIMDNMRQGRNKAIWISKNQPLFVDAIRDWTALGNDKDDIMNLSKIETGTSINANAGILFTTYDTLKQNYELGKSDKKIVKGKKPRLSQIVEWVGKDFDGVLVFDESHMMQSGIATKTKSASLSALAGMELQKQLPKARIVYASATGATEVQNLAYASRLGLWGEDTPFDNVNAFVSKISEGGLAAMELVARDLKAAGLYLARSLSYDGVKYRTLMHKLTKEQRDMYNTLAHSWQIVLQNIEKALDATGQKYNANARKFASGRFWSSQQTFFNLVMTSMSMPSVIEDIKTNIDDGNACVLQITSTNEALLNRKMSQMDEGDSLEDLDLTPRDLLMNFVEKAFPTQQFEEYQDDKGNMQSKPVFDKAGHPVQNKKAIAMKEELLTKIGALKIPEGPLDIIINSFGTEAVAEVTDRTRRIVRKKDPDTDLMKTILERRSDKSVAADVQAFQNGTKNILIFSEAGGTGKSYHADLTTKNQKHRVHYLVQAGWKADSAVQGFGRTHRTNQASAPTYVLITTELKGQKRFISSIARRLDQLGALTKGQRQTGSQGMFSASDNLESEIAKDALAKLYKNIVNGAYSTFKKDDFFSKMGLTNALLNEFGQLKDTTEVRNITRFLNRMLSLEIDMQNAVFDAYNDVLEELTRIAQANGTLDKGLENYKADRVVLLESKAIRKDPQTGAETTYYELEAHHKNKPLHFSIFNTDDSDFIGFYQNEKSGSVKAVKKGMNTTLDNGEVIETYKLYGQVDDASTYDRISIEGFEKGNWKKLSLEEAQTKWNEALEKMPEYKKQKLHLIGGMLLPIWDKFNSDHVKVIRVKTVDGDVLLGRMVRPSEIQAFLRKFDIDKQGEQYAAEELVNLIKDGHIVYLKNGGWKIMQRRVSNENRIELIGPEYSDYEIMKDKGLFAERIGYVTRYFIPADEKAPSVIEAVLKRNPLERVVNKNELRKEAYSLNPMRIPEPHEATNNIPDTPLKRLKNNVKGIENNVDTPQKIVQHIRETFHIPISSKRYNKRKALGYYVVGKQYMGIKWPMDLQTIVHELGHHLDDQYQFSYAGYAAFKSMIDQLPKEWVKGYTKNELPGEAVAEFVRRYLVNPDIAQEFSPEFYATFEESLSSEDLKKIHQLQDYMTNWYTKGLEQKTIDTISHYSGRARETLDHKIVRMRMQLFDDLYPLKLFDEAVSENSGIKLKGNRQAYKLALNSRGADGIAQSCATLGLVSPDGEIVGASFKDILKGIKNSEFAQFEAYLKNKHAIDRHKVGKIVYTEDIDIDQLEILVNNIEREKPHWVSTANGLYDWWKDFIELWYVDTGFIDREVFQSWRETYPHYVPMYRDIENASPKGAKRGYSNQKSHIKAARGGTSNTFSPIESMLRDIDRVVKIVKRNEVMRTVHENYQKYDGLSEFLRPVPQAIEAHKYDAETLKERLIRALAKDSIEKLPEEEKKQFYKLTYKQQKEYILAAGLNKNAQMVDDLVDDVITYFTPKHINFDNQVVSVITSTGETKYYEVTNDLFLRALMNTSRTELEGWLKAADKITRASKLLITGANVIFAVTSNIWRDTLNAYIFGSIKNPAKFMVELSKAFYDVIANTSAYKEYRAMGGGHSSSMANSRRMLDETLNDIIPGRKTRKDQIAGYGLSLLERFNDAIETAPRLQEYKQQKRTSYGDRVEALYRANDITLNFKKHGEKSRSIDAVVFFFNAGMQELDKLYRAAFEEKEVVISRLIKTVATLSLFSLVLAAANSDDDDYKLLSRGIKDAYWVIKNPFGKEPEFYRFPKPKGPLAMLFSSGVQRAVDRYIGGDKEAYKGYKAAVLKSFMPATSTIFSPITDILQNKTFYGGPIVTGLEAELPARYQFDDTTSEISKLFGDKLNISPKKLDYGIRQYSGIIGQVLLPITTKGEGLHGFVTSLGRKITADPAYSNDAVSTFYDNRDLLSKNKEAAEKLGFSPLVQKLPKAEQEAARAEFYNMRLELNAWAQRFKEVNKEIDEISKSKKLTDEEIQKMIHERKMKIVNKAMELNVKVDDLMKKYSIKSTFFYR